LCKISSSIKIDNHYSKPDANNAHLKVGQSAQRLNIEILLQKNLDLSNLNPPAMGGDEFQRERRRLAIRV
jgi:hypothetical protein